MADTRHGPPAPFASPCSNVLLTADLRACISDLGASQLAASMGRSVIGLTLCYAAPEQLLGRCTVASDMFSFGEQVWLEFGESPGPAAVAATAGGSRPQLCPLCARTTPPSTPTHRRGAAD